MGFFATRLLAVLLVCTLACAQQQEDAVEQTSTESSDLVQPDGKLDTGYYSNLATELEGVFQSVIELDLNALSEDERVVQLDFYQSDTNALTDLVRQQVKLSKGQLVDMQLHLNLLSGDVEIQDIALDGPTLRIKYVVQAESLATYDELHEVGLTAQDLVSKRFDVKVALDPRDLFARSGENCAANFEHGTLGEHNFFYYFDPDATTCVLPMAPESFFEVRALLAQATTYPEFDRLTADGRLDVAIFFGKAEDIAHDGDWGVMMWRSFEVHLRLRDFEMVDGLTVGQRYQRVRGDLVENIDLVSPYDLENLGDAALDFFAQMFRDHEIVMYNGHSFYGSLNVLNDPANYPEDTYQILFMNSCWSYEYYTKQVFENKVTEADPTGWALADVVNNTTYAYFSQMEISTRVLLFNLLAGAESGGIDDQNRRFSWQHIIGVLNDEAVGKCPVDADPMDCRHYQPRSKHEVYGVSGARSNLYQP